MLINKLINNKFYFYGFFLLIWLCVQLLSNNLQYTLNPAFETEDASSYLDGAKALLTGNYPWFRAVGYPFILAPFLGIFGKSFTLIFFTITQCLLWLAIVRLIHSIIKIWRNDEKLALLGSALYAVFISPILYTNHLLTETVYTYLLILSVFLFSKYLNDKTFKHVYWIFPILAFSALVRPVGLYIFYASIPLAFFVFQHSFKKTIIFFFASITLLVSHLFLMYSFHGTAQMCLSKNLAINFYLIPEIINYPDMNKSTYIQNHIDGLQKEIKPFENHPKQYKLVDSMIDSKNKVIFHNTSLYPIIKILYVNFKDELAEGYNNYGVKKWARKTSGYQHITIFIILIIGIISGVFNHILDKRKPNLLIFLFVLLGVIGFFSLASSIVFWYGDRLHLPFYPIIVILLCLCLPPRRNKTQSNDKVQY